MSIISIIEKFNSQLMRKYGIDKPVLELKVNSKLYAAIERELSSNCVIVDIGNQYIGMDIMGIKILSKNLGASE